MRIYRFAITAVAALVVIAGTARPASAAPHQLCLRDEPNLIPNFYYLNFSVQGNSILVSGTKGNFGDDHGPLFGSLAKANLTSPTGGWELGLTVTFQNGGDYANGNTENVVFTFNTDGSITYKRWKSNALTFEQGHAAAFTCPE